MEARGRCAAPGRRPSPSSADERRQYTPAPAREIKRDRAWLADHAADIAAASPPLVSSLVYLFRAEPADWLGPTLARVAQAPGVGSAAVRKEVTRRVPEPARSAVLAALP